jgi:hypothetical protein
MVNYWYPERVKHIDKRASNRDVLFRRLRHTTGVVVCQDDLCGVVP